MNTTQQADHGVVPFPLAGTISHSLVETIRTRSHENAFPLWMASFEDGSTRCSIDTHWNDIAVKTIWADAEKESTLFFSQKKVQALALAFHGDIHYITLPEALSCYSYSRHAVAGWGETSVWISTVFGFLRHDLRLVYRVERYGYHSCVEKQSDPLTL